MPSLDLPAITIRPGIPQDAARLAEFNIAMAWETESFRLDPDIILPGVQAVLEDPGKGLYFVAEVDGQIAGQLMVTREWSDWRNSDIWWIQSVYVHPDHRRRGVFKALYRHAEAQAKQHGVSVLRLYVEQHNHPAQATYQSLGMRLSHYLVMQADLAPAKPSIAD